METLQTLQSMEILKTIVTIAYVVKILFSRCAQFKKTKKGLRITIFFPSENK